MSNTETCLNCGRDMAWQEYGPPINDAHWYHLHNNQVFCDRVESVEEVLKAWDDNKVARVVEQGDQNSGEVKSNPEHLSG